MENVVEFNVDGDGEGAELDPSVLEGGGIILLIGGGNDGAMGFAPSARAADVIGLDVVGSDWVETDWGATDRDDRVEIVGGGGDWINIVGMTLH